MPENKRPTYARLYVMYTQRFDNRLGPSTGKDYHAVFFAKNSEEAKKIQETISHKNCDLALFTTSMYDFPNNEAITASNDFLISKINTTTFSTKEDIATLVKSSLSLPPQSQPADNNSTVLSSLKQAFNSFCSSVSNAVKNVINSFRPS